MIEVIQVLSIILGFIVIVGWYPFMVAVVFSHILHDDWRFWRHLE